MKAIMVMFDSLNRAMLESYGCTWTRTPNFKRLAQRATQFENWLCGQHALHARPAGAAYRAPQFSAS